MWSIWGQRPGAIEFGYPMEAQRREKLRREGQKAAGRGAHTKEAQGPCFPRAVATVVAEMQ
eukprot:2061306-Lingulodinium_polyedra.AAC.1